MFYKLYEINLKNTNREELLVALKELDIICNNQRRTMCFKIESSINESPSFKEADYIHESDFGWGASDIGAESYIFDRGVGYASINEIVEFIMDRTKDYR